MTSRPKRRQALTPQLAAHVLVAANRTCCVCEQQNDPLQIHHIDGDPGHNTIDNLAVLCLRCHYETQIQGGFSRRLDQAQMTLYRNYWIQTVARERGYPSAIVSLLLIVLMANQRLLNGYHLPAPKEVVLDTHFAAYISSPAIPDRSIAHQLSLLAEGCQRVNDATSSLSRANMVYVETLLALFDQVIDTLTRYLAT